MNYVHETTDEATAKTEPHFHSQHFRVYSVMSEMTLVPIKTKVHVITTIVVIKALKKYNLMLNRLPLISALLASQLVSFKTDQNVKGNFLFINLTRINTCM